MDNQGRIYVRFLMDETGDLIAAYGIRLIPRGGDEIRLTNGKWYEVVRVQFMHDAPEETIRVILKFVP